MALPADYVAPEQALNSHDVDIRADIYGLGATFYFLLVGHPLFSEGQIAQKLIWHQTRRPTPLRELRPDVPAELATLIECMIDKNPDRRYQSPAEVIEALADWTVTPVPPPADVEMPRLSPAARAAAVADADSGSNLSRQRPRSMAELPTPALARSPMNTPEEGLIPRRAGPGASFGPAGDPDRRAAHSLPRTPLRNRPLRDHGRAHRHGHSLGDDAAPSHRPIGVSSNSPATSRQGATLRRERPTHFIPDALLLRWTPSAIRS